MEEHSALKKRSLIASAAILGSRAFGLVREQMFAHLFGATFVNDAFIVAFRIPNLFRNLFAEGALSQAFVTVFSQRQESDEAGAKALANQVLTLLVCVLGTLVLLGMIFAPQIVHFIAPGFDGERFALTVTLARILFPFVLFVSLAAVFMGILNAKNIFFLPQSASTAFNLTVILSGALIGGILHPALITGIQGMALGFLIGGLVQWLIQAPTLYKLGFRFKLDFDFKSPHLKKILQLTLPSIIGGAAMQINVIVNTYFASRLPVGSISYLSYAFRIVQFPLGVFGAAVAIAAAPMLAKLLSQNRHNDMKARLQQSLQMSLFMAVPASFGLCVLSKPIIALILEHGHFTANDTNATALALQTYALSIVSYTLIKIYQLAFLSFHDAKTPMRIAIASIGLNFILNWIFITRLNLSYWGLSLGTSIVAAFNVLALAIYFRKKMPEVWDREFLIVFAKIILASIVMLITAYVSHEFLVSRIPEEYFTNKVILALVPMALAAGIYFAVARVQNISNILFAHKTLNSSRDTEK